MHQSVPHIYFWPHHYTVITCLSWWTLDQSIYSSISISPISIAMTSCYFEKSVLYASCIGFSFTSDNTYIFGFALSSTYPLTLRMSYSILASTQIPQNIYPLQSFCSMHLLVNIFDVDSFQWNWEHFIRSRICVWCSLYNISPHLFVYLQAILAYISLKLLYRNQFHY